MIDGMRHTHYVEGGGQNKFFIYLKAFFLRRIISLLYCSVDFIGGNELSDDFLPLYDSNALLGLANEFVGELGFFI